MDMEWILPDISYINSKKVPYMLNANVLSFRTTDGSQWTKTCGPSPSFCPLPPSPSSSSPLCTSSSTSSTFGQAARSTTQVCMCVFEVLMCVCVCEPWVFVCRYALLMCVYFCLCLWLVYPEHGQKKNVPGDFRNTRWRPGCHAGGGGKSFFF